jgi:RHS repeat-associated protein
VGRSGDVVLSYDPLGRLVSVSSPTTATQFLYDGDALVAEYAAGVMTRRYVHNVGADVPLLSYEGATLASPFYLHADHQGSIVAISGTTGSGTLNSYDEYGYPAIANSGRFQYTGQIWIPELGMYHYKARVYSPGLGRFLQTDPIGYQDQFNLYAYVGNDPINSTDPTGTCMTGSRLGDSTQCRVHVGYQETRTSASGISPRSGMAPRSGTPPGQANGARTYLASAESSSDNSGPAAPRTFLPPTNPPGFPPGAGEPYFEDGAVWGPGPNGSRYLYGGADSRYPNGYWRQQVGNQYVDPSTGKPPGNVSRAEFNARTHVPMPEVRDPPFHREESSVGIFFRGLRRWGGIALCIILCESPAQ